MKARKNLLKENKELKIRLTKVEKLLTKIKSDALNAFVSNEHKIFPLKKSNLKYAENKIIHLASFPHYNPQPVIEINRNGKVIFSNQATIKILKEKETSKEINLFFPEDFNQILKTLRSGKKKIYSREVKIKDLFFLETITVLPELQVIRIYAHDITKHKRAEQILCKNDEELKKLNRTLKALSDSNQAMIRATNEETYLNNVCKIIVKDCNHAMVWIGYAEDDEAKTVRPVAQAGFEEGYLKTIDITWADIERGRGPTGTAIRTGKPSICRNMLTDHNFKPWRQEAIKRGYASSIVLPLIKDCKVFGVINIYSKYPDPFSEQEVQLLSELAEDLAYGIQTIRFHTKHAKLEEALLYSRNLLESIIDNTTAYIYVFDLKEHFIAINKALAELLNSTPKLMIGKKRQEFMPGNTADWHKASDQEVIKAGKPLEFEEYGNFNGRSITFLTIKFPLFDIHGNIYAIAGISNDISDRKKAENIMKHDKETFERLVQEKTRELVESQLELEKAKRLSDIGVLAATVAHELRNPLATINLAVNNIKRKSKKEKIINFNKHLTNIEKKIGDSDQIINNLLFYSRIKPPNFEKVDIFNLLKEPIELIEHKHKNDISIIKNIDSLRNISIEADPVQINEVFNNILNNAVDAVAPGKGEIKIISENLNEFVKITIKDNGNGIEKEYLEKVFDPFFTTKTKGTGLGLSVCQQIVNFHNGSICIESEVGQKTTVTLCLPKERKKSYSSY